MGRILNKNKVVVFTGAGISAESGIRTFRDSDGLWNEYLVEDVATPGAWARNPELVLNFYNDCRDQMTSAFPMQPIRPLLNCKKSTKSSSSPRI